MYYIILYYTILYYTILYYTILYYTILYYTILYYTVLYYTEDNSRLAETRLAQNTLDYLRIAELTLNSHNFQCMSTSCEPMSLRGVCGIEQNKTSDTSPTGHSGGHDTPFITFITFTYTFYFTIQLLIIHTHNAIHF